MFRRNVVPTVVVAALLFGLVLSWSLRHSPHQVEQHLTEFAAIGLHQASIVVRHQGERQAEVHAERVTVSRDLRYATFSGAPRIIAFSQGREVFRVRGSRIVLDRQTGDVSVQGPVEVVSARGERLMAGTGRWIDATQRLVFEQHVTMEVGDQEVVAEQLTIDVRQWTLDFSGAVDVAFRLKGVKL
jgi:LPS export ABC transporter protein LptC